MITKYSIGGPITSVEDQDSIEKKEDPAPIITNGQVSIITCGKCGLQHMTIKGETRICCGKSLESDKLS